MNAWVWEISAIIGSVLSGVFAYKAARWKSAHRLLRMELDEIGKLAVEVTKIGDSMADKLRKFVDNPQLATIELAAEVCENHRDYCRDQSEIWGNRYHAVLANEWSAACRASDDCVRNIRALAIPKPEVQPKSSCPTAADRQPGPAAT